MSTASISTESKLGDAGKPVTSQWRYFWLMLTVAFTPMMVPYFTNLWSREPYRYFPFCVLAVGWLTYSRWDRQFHIPRGALSWIAIGATIPLTVFGILIASPWICAVAFVIFASTFFFSSKDMAGRSLIGLAIPLIMLINLPLGYDQLTTIRLQQVTTGLSSVLLDVLAIPHAVSNNVIQLTSRELFVAEACSGIQSVFTLMFLATLLIAVYRRPIWMTPIYLAIAALLAVAANVIRVTMVAIGDVWLSVDLAEGWQHEIVGYTALLIGTLLLLSFDHLVVTLLHPVDPVVDGENNLIIAAWNYIVGDEGEDRTSGSSRRKTATDRGSSRFSTLWQSLWSRRILAGLLSVISLAGIAQAVHLQQPLPIFIKPTEVVYQPEADVFERDFGSLEVIEHERARGGSNPRLGENADIWTCAPRHVAAEIQVVLSQPYAGWHELCICYEINAWILLSRDIRGAAAAAVEREKNSIPYVFARFKSSDGRFAYLIYSAVDAEGQIMVPPPRPGRLGNRFIEYFGEPRETVTSNLMMMQMLIVSKEKLEAEPIRELAADFIEMRSIIQQGVKQNRSSSQQDNGAPSPASPIPSGEQE